MEIGDWGRGVEILFVVLTLALLQARPAQADDCTTVTATVTVPHCKLPLQRSGWEIMAPPGVRYFAFRDLMGLAGDSVEVQAARDAVMHSGPVPAILAQQHPDGYWIKPGYLPKYNGTMWSIIFLAQLGAARESVIVTKRG